MAIKKEGPVCNSQTGYYYFSARIGFPPDRLRIRFSLRTKDRARAQFLWEKEWKMRWGEYYGVRPAGHLDHSLTSGSFFPRPAKRRHYIQAGSGCQRSCRIDSTIEISSGVSTAWHGHLAMSIIIRAP